MDFITQDIPKDLLPNGMDDRNGFCIAHLIYEINNFAQAISRHMIQHPDTASAEVNVAFDFKRKSMAQPEHGLRLNFPCLLETYEFASPMERNSPWKWISK